jgi:hypothetical protein
LYGANGIYLNTLPIVISDLRLKENIINYTIEDPFNIIQNLTLKEYNLINNKFKKRELGYIAQEIEKVFPRAIENNNIIKIDENGNTIYSENEDGTINKDKPIFTERKSVQYNYLQFVNSEAIKILINENKMLKDKLAKQNDIINNQRRKNKMIFMEKLINKKKK